MKCTKWKARHVAMFMCLFSSFAAEADWSYVACFDFQDPLNPDNHCTSLQDSLELACDAYKTIFFERVPTRFEPGSGWVIDAVNASSPNNGGCFVDFAIHNVFSGVSYPHDTISSSGILAAIQTGYSVKTQSISQTCISCEAKSNAVAHPISPSTAATFDTIVDVPVSGSISYRRFYNSGDGSNANQSTGWQHSYLRKVVKLYSTISAEDYLQSGNTSSRYASPSAACANGFAEVKSKVSQWNDALVSYSNGNCVMEKNGTYIGLVMIKASGGSFSSAPTPVAYDVIRDDGQLIRFIVDGNGAIINPPGINLKLQKTISGFNITDSNDNVEQYDANGKLLTVTSRAGVVQTMSYDVSGRLSSVSDSFGHQLSFSYDAQKHLSTVTRQ